MLNWCARLIADKDGNPNEHIIGMLLGLFGLNVIAGLLIYTGHAIMLADYGGAHGLIAGATGAAQWASKGS